MDAVSGGGRCGLFTSTAASTTSLIVSQPTWMTVLRWRASSVSGSFSTPAAAAAAASAAGSWLWGCGLNSPERSTEMTCSTGPSAAWGPPATSPLLLALPLPGASCPAPPPAAAAAASPRQVMAAQGGGSLPGARCSARRAEMSMPIGCWVGAVQPQEGGDCPASVALRAKPQANWAIGERPELPIWLHTRAHAGCPCAAALLSLCAPIVLPDALCCLCSLYRLAGGAQEHRVALPRPHWSLALHTARGGPSSNTDAAQHHLETHHCSLEARLQPPSTPQ